MRASRLAFLLASVAVLALTLPASAFLGFGSSTPPDPAEQAKIEKERALREDRVEALASSLASTLDKRGLKSCPAHLTMTQEGVECRSYGYRGSIGERIWLLPYAALQPVFQHLIADEPFLVYKAKIGDATNLGELKANGAVSDLQELLDAHRRSGLKRGQEAIRRMKEGLPDLPLNDPQ